MHECVKPGNHAKIDEHESYFWLGKTTNARTCQRSRPTLHPHSIVCHKNHSSLRAALTLTKLRVKTLSSKAYIKL